MKAAKEAGMTYAVFTAKHHDGFAMWPSKYGNYNTKNYLGGRDFVKEFVNACRKYGLKVGLYFSPPDWHFDPDFQNFMYYGVARDYPNIPVLDQDLKPRVSFPSAKDSLQHYRNVAAYVKGQVEELLINYGKIDVIWFDKDGVPIIPAGDPAWDECITMEQVRRLQPGILVNPRLFGYGDYKSFESDGQFPSFQQDGWAEFCLNYLVRSKAFNLNMLLNYGPTKDGDFTGEMYKSLKEISAWMKVNSAAVKGTQALDSIRESASVPAAKRENHRYLFLLAPKQGASVVNEQVVLNTEQAMESVSLLGRKERLKYRIQQGRITIDVPANVRSEMPDVIDLKLK